MNTIVSIGAKLVRNYIMIQGVKLGAKYIVKSIYPSIDRYCKRNKIFMYRNIHRKF